MPSTSFLEPVGVAGVSTVFCGDQLSLLFIQNDSDGCRQIQTSYVRAGWQSQRVWIRGIKNGLGKPRRFPAENKRVPSLEGDIPDRPFRES